MFYKVMKNDKVIDVLQNLSYIKYQKKHDMMVSCSQSDAQGIISSDGQHIWHIDWLYRFPEEAKDRYEVVALEEIEEYEYKQLRALNMKTPEEIIDEYTLLLIEGGVL